MLTGPRRRLALVDSFTVTAGDTVLSRIYQFKYLGVMLDPYLLWNDHIDYIGRKILAKLGMLRKALKVIPRESCLTLYNVIYFQYSTIALSYGTPAVRLTESTWISCIVVLPVLLKATQSHNRRYLTLSVCRDCLKCMLEVKSLHGLGPASLLNEFSQPTRFPII